MKLLKYKAKKVYPPFTFHRDFGVGPFIGRSMAGTHEGEPIQRDACLLWFGRTVRRPKCNYLGGEFVCKKARWLDWGSFDSVWLWYLKRRVKKVLPIEMSAM